MDDPIKLTQYAHGAGCGCKISPATLEEILKSDTPSTAFEKLIVGNQSRDDAAVYDMGKGMAIISTTDFFMPIVDDAFDFGRIAAANSISDIYAMGGHPLMAIAILGWPVETLPASVAQRVMEGAKHICKEAGIPLAGGHSIDSPEPIFGLAVTGSVELVNLKRNNTAKAGNKLFLTKPLGTGILSTAQKRGLLKKEHLGPLINQMATLNSIGEMFGKIKGVTAMTDITGFGLLGHLIEIAESSDLSAILYYDKIHLMAGVKEYIQQRIFPDATTRNWNAYSTKVAFSKGVNVMEAFSLLPDPQTNGGLLMSVEPDFVDEVVNVLNENNLGEFVQPIGELIQREEKIVSVRA